MSRRSDLRIATQPVLRCDVSLSIYRHFTVAALPTTGQANPEGKWTEGAGT